MSMENRFALLASRFCLSCVCSEYRPNWDFDNVYIICFRFILIFIIAVLKTCIRFWSHVYKYGPSYADVSILWPCPIAQWGDMFVLSASVIFYLTIGCVHSCGIGLGSRLLWMVVLKAILKKVLKAPFQSTWRIHWTLCRADWVKVITTIMWTVDDLYVDQYLMIAIKHQQTY